MYLISNSNIFLYILYILPTFEVEVELSEKDFKSKSISNHGFKGFEFQGAFTYKGILTF